MEGEGKKWNKEKEGNVLTKKRKGKGRKIKEKEGNEMEERERKTCITKA